MSDVRFESVNALCQLMPRPLVVQGMLLTWMQQKFANKYGSIEDPTLKTTVVWDPDETKSQILIESVFRWKPSTTEQRPAVLLKRGAWKVLRLGIDDRKMGSTPLSGNPQYVTFLQGSHTLFCMSSAPAECETLATEVYREMVEFGPLFRQVFNLTRFVVTDVGEMSIVEEAHQNFVVPITCAYAAEETWEIVEQAPTLKHIKLSAFLP